MTLILLLAAGGLGAAVAGWGGARGGSAARAGAVVGTVALLLILVLSVALDAPRVGETGATTQAGAVLDGRVVATDYVRLVVALWALDSLLVVALAWLLGGLPALRGLLPATLAAITGGTVALGSSSLTLGVIAAAATGLAALVVVMSADRASAIPAAARELRASLGTGALLLAACVAAPVAAAIALGDRSTGLEGEASSFVGTANSEAGAVIGLTALAIVLAVGVRSSAIPFHLRVPRLSDVAPPVSMPLLLGWLPLPMAAAGLAAVDRLIAPLALPLDGERAIIVAFALVTLGAAALAAFIADDLRHSVGYLVIADGGLVLLGLAAMDPAAWGPTRVWLVALAASKTALAAWGAVAEARFETRSLPDLRGWIRRAPILAAGLALTVVATFGLPGWIVFVARGDLGRLAAGSPWDAVLVLAGFLTLPAYLRILGIGTGPLSSPVARAVPERIARGRRPAETLVVEVEGAVGGTPDGAGVGVMGPAGSDAGVIPAASAVSAAGAGSDAAASPPAAGSATAAGSETRAASVPAGRRRLDLRRPEAAASAARRFATALRRDRAELTSAAVLALAILAALTSWGALDIGGAASEPAPIVSGPSSD
jgi:NADH:ubiquinone oxidoreductase subunit 2 (subunit N)